MNFELFDSIWPSTQSSSPPDGLDIGNASTFFDFEAWDGDYKNTTVTLETPEDINTLDLNLDWTTEQQHSVNQAADERPWVQTPTIEPGLSPFADDILQDVLLHHPVHPSHGETTSLSDSSGLENGRRLVVLDASSSMIQSGPNDQDKMYSTEVISHAEMNTTPSYTACSGTPQKVPQPIDVPRKKKKRTRINDATKKMLNTHFSFNPYPTESETMDLARTTKLTAQIIKTWFTNRRSRPAAQDRKHRVYKIVRSVPDD